MAADIISILEHESVASPIIGIAHDWGTYLLSQLATYYSNRFQKFVFISVPFRPPGNMMDVHTVNQVTEKEMGYPMCEYWLFFTENGVGKLLGQHVSSIQFRPNLKLCSEAFLELRRKNAEEMFSGSHGLIFSTQRMRKLGQLH